LGVFRLCLAVVHVLTNRSLLDRAHDSANAIRGKAWSAKRRESYEGDPVTSEWGREHNAEI
jgi:hypothetical protein